MTRKEKSDVSGTRQAGVRSSSEFPPLVHAVGGSVGGALALLLLYPLERARIELQASVASERRLWQPLRGELQHADDDIHDDDDDDNKNNNDGNDDDTGFFKRLGNSSTSTLEYFEAATGQIRPPETAEANTDDRDASDDESWTDALMISAATIGKDKDKQHQQEQEVDETKISQPSMSGSRHSTTHEDDPLLSSTNDILEEYRVETEPTSSSKVTVWECFIRIYQRGELYRGAAPVVTTLAISNFVFFWIQSLLRRKQLASQWLLRAVGSGTKSPSSWPSRAATAAAFDSLLASIVGGILNVLLTNPLWVANLRIVTGQAVKQSLWAELWYIATTQQGAIAKLWQGTGSSLLLVSNPVIQFLCYEHIRTLLLQQQHGPMPAATLSPNSAFWLGAATKAVSTMITYPLQLAQAVMRLQNGHNNNNSNNSNNNEDDGNRLMYKGTYDCLRQIYRRGGMRGLYVGLKAKMLQTVLTAAFTFLTYEQILRAVHSVLIQNNTSGVLLPQ